MSLLDLQPHVVSRDLSGYSVFLYGDAKSGKTTTASKFKNPLILAFEIGYNALPGVYAKPMNSWSELIRVLQELKDEKVKEKFSTIIIDTIDLAAEACEEYICSINGVNKINEIPYGQGWPALSKELDKRLREITQLGYGLVLISHAKDKTFTDTEGNETNRIVPTLSDRAKLICSRMCDIYGYIRPIQKQDGTIASYMFLRGTPRFEAGCRFKYAPEHIELSYDNLVNAIADAIDKEANENNNQFITDEKNQIVQPDKIDISFEEIREEIDSIIANLMTKNPSENGPKITSIVESILGKGNKLNETTYKHVDLLLLIRDSLMSL